MGGGRKGRGAQVRGSLIYGPEDIRESGVRLVGPPAWRLLDFLRSVYTRLA